MKLYTKFEIQRLITRPGIDSLTNMECTPKYRVDRKGTGLIKQDWSFKKRNAKPATCIVMHGDAAQQYAF